MKIIRESEFESEVLQHRGKVLVDFYADWCEPCQAQAPILEFLEAQQEECYGEDIEFKFVKVNVDESTGLAALLKVDSIPTLLLFENGMPIHRAVGVQTEDDLRKILEAAPLCLSGSKNT